MRRHNEGNEQLVIAGQQRHRLEILYEIIRQGVNRAVDHVRAGISQNQRVAIRCRARDPPDGNAARRAGDVFDDHGLAERNPHRLADDAREHVRRSGRRERHDHGHGSRRISLRPRDPRYRRQRGSTRHETQQSPAVNVHWRPSVVPISTLSFDRGAYVQRFTLSG